MNIDNQHNGKYTYVTRRTGSGSVDIACNRYGSLWEVRKARIIEANDTKTYDRRRRDWIGIRPMSTVALLGGVCSLVGGVDPSDRPEDPSVDGRPSESLLLSDFLRAGTPSGHVHCQNCCQKMISSTLYINSYISLAMCAPHAVWLRLVTLYVLFSRPWDSQKEFYRPLFSWPGTSCIQSYYEYI